MVSAESTHEGTCYCGHGQRGAKVPVPGAFGVKIEGSGGRSRLAAAANEGWPVLRLDNGSLAAGGELGVSAERAVLELGPRARLVADRSARSATVVAPRALDPDELFQPCLGTAAALIARWDGREALHAATVLIAGRAWALLGTNGSGKSTLAAAFALAGYPVLAEDLLVLDGGTAFAGPRCVDLRPPAAHHFAHRAELEPSRGGLRRRLHLPPVPAEVELAGWVFLADGERLTVERVSPGERLGRLARHRRRVLEGTDPRALLGLAALPALELRRPMRFELLEEAVERIAEAAQANARYSRHPQPGSVTTW